jgi:recombinational DNA repair protein RecT
MIWLSADFSGGLYEVSEGTEHHFYKLDVKAVTELRISRQWIKSFKPLHPNVHWHGDNANENENYCMYRWVNFHSNFQKTEFWRSSVEEVPITFNFQKTEFWRSDVEGMPLTAIFQKTEFWRSSVKWMPLTANFQKT